MARWWRCCQRFLLGEKWYAIPSHVLFAYRERLRGNTTSKQCLPVWQLRLRHFCRIEPYRQVQQENAARRCLCRPQKRRAGGQSKCNKARKAAALSTAVSGGNQRSQQRLWPYGFLQWQSRYACYCGQFAEAGGSAGRQAVQAGRQAMPCYCLYHMFVVKQRWLQPTAAASAPVSYVYVPRPWQQVQRALNGGK
ncbi:hypothetical protein NPIL_7001 [Nephila pilipes]|uniref:Uncharacterized protein n=1 Tax=Nephila pilipes TaxID=299642 RepID=A0A8X6UGB2_NEPPI|nr:hypothetical protein NPIL_7001 [Nephila pilipes]